MNGATQNLCNALGRDYVNRVGPDLQDVRSHFIRGRSFIVPKEISELSIADQFAVLATPGDSEMLVHRGGIHLTIEGEMLPDFDSDRYVKEIERTADEITIRINSGGGNLPAAFAIHDALLAAGPARVSAMVFGFCGSAATIILSAADKRRIINGSTLWVHRPADFGFGQASSLRLMADALDSILERMATAYRRIIQPELVGQWLGDDSDKIFDAQSALACGLGTVLEEPITA